MPGVTLTNTSTVTGTVANAIDKFVAPALIVRDHEGVMDKLTDVKPLAQKKGDTYYEPYFGALTSSQLVDGIELDSAQQLTDAVKTVIPNEFGLMVAISKWSDAIASENLFSIAGRMMSRANEYKRDVTGLAMFDNFSTSLGGATTTLVAGHISAGVSNIRVGMAGTDRTGARDTGDPAPPPYHCVIHEYSAFSLAALQSGLYYNTSAQSTTNANMAFGTVGGSISPYQAKWIEEHYLGKFRGVNVITDNNLTITSNATKGAIFAKESLIHLKFRGLNKKEDESRDGRVIYMTLTDAWGWGERNDVWGNELYTYAVQPTT